MESSASVSYSILTVEGPYSISNFLFQGQYHLHGLGRVSGDAEKDPAR